MPWCAADNDNYMCRVCAKGFLNLNFNWAVIDKNIKFSQNCPKFHILTKIIIFKYTWTFLDHLLLPYYPIKFMAGACKECSFSILPV